MKEETVEHSQEDVLFLEGMKQKFPTNYLHMIKRMNREKVIMNEDLITSIETTQKKVDAIKGEVSLVTGQINGQKEKISNLETKIHWIESQRGKEAINQKLMEDEMKRALYDYISLQKYEVVKLLFSRWKTKQKKGPNVQACLVFYVLDDPFSQMQTSKGNSLRLPYLVAPPNRRPRPSTSPRAHGYRTSTT
jgi:hypothetical protein